MTQIITTNTTDNQSTTCDQSSSVSSWANQVKGAASSAKASVQNYYSNRTISKIALDVTVVAGGAFALYGVMSYDFSEIASKIENFLVLPEAKVRLFNLYDYLSTELEQANSRIQETEQTVSYLSYFTVFQFFLLMGSLCSRIPEPPGQRN